MKVADEPPLKCDARSDSHWLVVVVYVAFDTFKTIIIVLLVVGTALNIVLFAFWKRLGVNHSKSRVHPWTSMYYSIFEAS